MPNLQNAVETNIPLLSSIMIGFAGALFVAVAISDLSFLRDPVNVLPIPFVSTFSLDLPFDRRAWIMGACFLAGLAFYSCIHHCVYSQLSNYQEDNTDIKNNQKIALYLSGGAHATSKELELILKGWEVDRQHHATLALSRYNLGEYLVVLPLIFVLPPEMIAPGAYFFLCYTSITFWKHPKNRLRRWFRQRRRTK